jgi:hypothetical protein
VIGEPEMVDDGGQEAARDTVGDADRPPLLGRYGGKPWVWAACAAVLTSAVWAGTLQATGYGRTHAPDLHGYHVSAGLCTGGNFRGLLDALDAHPFQDDAAGAIITRSSAVDRAECDVSAIGGPGARTEFTVSVTVDLHKKTDPAAEFDAVEHVELPTPDYGTAVLSVSDPPPTHPRGIGDRANLTTTKYRQKLAVRHGGAVITLALTATAEVTEPDKDGNPQAARPVDTRKYAGDLAPAMLHLMSVLARPAGVSGSSSPR